MAGRPRVLLAILAVALLHPLVQARVRPLYQVSDELAYLHTAQLVALPGAAPAAQVCIAPPDGVPLQVGEGGKRGYALVTGAELRALCAREGQRLPVFLLRALQALSLPVVALAAWYLARLPSGSHVAGLLAALFVSIHPVAAKYAAGITPDAWANAFSAGVLVGLTRTVMGRQRWWDAWLMAACAFAGMLWKDTTNMLVPLTAIGIALTAADAVRRRRGPTAGRSWLPVVSLAATTAVSIVVAARWWGLLRTHYIEIMPESDVALVDAPRVLMAVVQNVITHAAGFLASAVLSLYRPLVYGPGAGAGQPVTPDAVTAIVVGLLIAGIGGGVLQWIHPRAGMRRLPGRVLGIWTLTLALAIVQPSLRQVLLDVGGLHQGRWLFPALAPVAALVGIGLAHLGGRRPATLPLAALACLASLWVVVIDIVRHYYVAFPSGLRRASLFTRPTGEVDIGDAAVVRLIEQVTTAQDPLVTWGILVLLMAASLALAVSAIRYARCPVPHV